LMSVSLTTLSSGNAAAGNWNFWCTRGSSSGNPLSLRFTEEEREVPASLKKCGLPS
ncbi:hypothetical protein NDU88_006626, partial [Pleurodeles waltl]